MRTLTSRCLLTISACLVAGCQGETARFTADDEMTLRGMFDSVVAEVSSGRWEAWAGHYATDAYLQPPNAPTVRGRSALLEWGKAFPPVESLSFSEVQVTGEGNMAYGSSSYALKLKDMPLDRGKQLTVFPTSSRGRLGSTCGQFRLRSTADGASAGRFPTLGGANIGAT